MIRGRVTPALEAQIALELIGNEGQTHTVEVILDTGFEGDLILPLDIIRRLGLTSVDDYRAILADGREAFWAGYEGRVLWHGRPRSALILESDGEALLGMNLLWRSRVTLDVRANGDVVIEELG